MKVLAIVPDFIEKPSGGLGEQFRHMMRELDGKVDYYIVGYPERNSIKNFKPAIAPIPFPHAALSTIYGQSIYFLKALEFKEEFDVIHAFDWSTFYAGWLCKEHFKKPLICSVNLSLKQLNTSGIYYCHDPKTIDGIHVNQLQVYFEELGLMSADRVIQVSKYYKDLYKQYDNKTDFIQNGIEIDKWVQKRTPKLPGKNKLKFCYIGRASSMKGIDLLLSCDIPEDIDFYFVVSEKNAEEPYFSKIKEKCNKKNIFHIPGLYGQDKVDFLFTMDGVVMPSKHEPFGIVALESLISENLFITTATGGINEIVKDIDYFKIGSSDDLLETFNLIKKLSQERVKEITDKGKKKALEYPWSKFAEKLLSTYHSVIDAEKVIEFY